jgi:hypothetical protein
MAAIFFIVGLAAIGGGSAAAGVVILVLGLPFLFVKEGRVQGANRGSLSVRFASAPTGSSVTLVGDAPVRFRRQVERVASQYDALAAGGTRPALEGPVP